MAPKPSSPNFCEELREVQSVLDLHTSSHPTPSVRRGALPPIFLASGFYEYAQILNPISFRILFSKWKKIFVDFRAVKTKTTITVLLKEQLRAKKLQKIASFILQ